MVFSPLLSYMLSCNTCLIFKTLVDSTWQICHSAFCWQAWRNTRRWHNCCSYIRCHRQITPGSIMWPPRRWRLPQGTSPTTARIRTSTRLRISGAYTHSLVCRQINSKSISKCTVSCQPSSGLQPPLLFPILHEFGTTINRRERSSTYLTHVYRLENIRSSSLHKDFHLAESSCFSLILKFFWSLQALSQVRATLFHVFLLSSKSYCGL